MTLDQTGGSMPTPLQRARIKKVQKQLKRAAVESNRIFNKRFRLQRRLAALQDNCDHNDAAERAVRPETSDIIVCRICGKIVCTTNT